MRLYPYSRITVRQRLPATVHDHRRYHHANLLSLCHTAHRFDAGIGRRGCRDAGCDAVAAAMLPVAPLLTADGTLRTDGLAAGVLDLTGWDVNLDPTRGPLFRPAMQASSAGWEHLGQRTRAAISSVVTSIVFDGNGNLYIGGTF